MILDGRKISVAPHGRSKPHAKKKAITTANLLGYVRTERCRQQEAALNRMALQLTDLVERETLTDRERESF